MDPRVFLGSWLVVMDLNGKLSGSSPSLGLSQRPPCHSRVSPLEGCKVENQATQISRCDHFDARVEASDSHGSSALVWASRAGHTKVVKL